MHQHVGQLIRPAQSGREPEPPAAGHRTHFALVPKRLLNKDIEITFLGYSLKIHAVAAPIGNSARRVREHHHQGFRIRRLCFPNQCRHGLGGAVNQFWRWHHRTVDQRLGMLQKAGKESDQEMTITPQEPWSYENRGEVCLDLGQTDMAIKFYREALARRAQLPKSLARLGKAYLRSGETAQGIRYLKEAVGIEPGIGSYRYQLG